MGNRSPRRYPCESEVSAAPITAISGAEQHPLFPECAGLPECSLKISRHPVLPAAGASILNQTTQESHPRGRKARYE